MTDDRLTAVLMHYTIVCLTGVKSSRNNFLRFFRLSRFFSALSYTLYRLTHLFCTLCIFFFNYFFSYILVCGRCASPPTPDRINHLEVDCKIKEYCGLKLKYSKYSHAGLFAAQIVFSVGQIYPSPILQPHASRWRWRALSAYERSPSQNKFV